MIRLFRIAASSALAASLIAPSLASAQSTLPSAPATPLAIASGQPAAQSASATLPPPPPPPDPRHAIPSAPGAITMREATAKALSDNPALVAARRNLDATRAQEIQAGVRVNPNLNLTGQDVTLDSSNPASPYAYSAQISRLFERGQKRRWRIDIAKATTAQTDAQLHDQERSTVLATQQAFTNMLVAKAALQLAEANVADFQHEIDINRIRFQAGDIGKLDFERLDLQLASFESDRSQAVINLRQASDQLQTLMGVAQPTQGFDITGDIVPPDLQLDLQSLDDKALANRPDYKAAQFGVQLAEGNRKLAYANGTTDPTLEGEYDRVATYNSAGFQVGIPLRIFDRNQGNKQTAELSLQSSQFTLVAAKNQVLSDVDQAWVGYTESKALSDRYNSHYLDESLDVLRISQFAYDHGGLALIDYLDALRDARQTTSDALNAFGATWLALQQLSASSAANLLP